MSRQPLNIVITKNIRFWHLLDSQYFHRDYLTKMLAHHQNKNKKRCFLVLRKSINCWFSLCFGVVLLRFYSIFCITLFGDCTHLDLQHQETTEAKVLLLGNINTHILAFCKIGKAVTNLSSFEGFF